MRSMQELILNINEGAGAAHAYACEGRQGDARSAFMTDFAAGLLCTHDDIRRRPCRRCPACLQAAAGTSMDIVHMNKSTGSSGTGRETYRVDDAGAFIERLGMGSYGRYLIGIIDDGDSLSETIQNKLLKTLEEPAPNTIILIGVTNSDNLLGTVRSRTSSLRLPDYAEYTGAADGTEEENADSALPAGSEALIAMYADRSAAFYEVRSALDKNIKSRENALALLDAVEDVFRDRMTGARGDIAADPQACAYAIEQIGRARMDVRREMQYGRALRRLYLELM